jgi:rod shape-determining protein MreD
MVYQIDINLAALAVVLVGLYKEATTAAWFGFAAGLVLAADAPDMMGWHGLALTVLGIAANQLREAVNLESIDARLAAVGGGVLLHNIACALFDQSGDFLHLLWAQCLGGAVYSMAVAWIFFMIKDGKLSFKRIKSVF